MPPSPSPFSEQLKRLHACFPKATLRLDDHGKLILCRYPGLPEETIDGNRILNSMLKRNEDAWRTIVQLAQQHQAAVLMPREDYYGPQTKISYCCNHEGCGRQWENTYGVMKHTVYMWQQKDLLPEERPYVFCPSCRRQLSKAKTQAGIFGGMTPDGLLRYARKTPASHRANLQTFYKKQAVLATTMRNTKDGNSHLLSRFSKEQGWRALRPELTEWGYEEWYNYLAKHNFINTSHWKEVDGRAQQLCLKLHKNTFYPKLYETFFGTPILYHEGTRYDSLAELYVAKALQYLQISFLPHGKWGFSKPGGKRSLEYDFKFMLDGQEIIIEVWLVSEKTLLETEKNDPYLQDYLERREYKIKQCSLLLPEKRLVEVEARVLKLYGAETYLNHVAQQLTEIGINNAKDLKDGDIIVYKEKIEDWTEDDYFRECIDNRWRQLTDMPPGFQARLRNNSSMQTAVAIKLSKHYKYPLNTRYYLAPMNEVIAFVTAHPELHGKDPYIEAHSSGGLPPGFPQNPTAIYPQLESWHQLWGKEPFRKLDYHTAKAAVQKFAFKSQTEYENARGSDDPNYSILKQIPKLPDHRTTGYPEWENWPTFLGYTLRWIFTEEAKPQLECLRSGSVLSVVRMLRRQLKCFTKGELRGLSGRAAEALDTNPRVTDIEILAFGETSHLITDWDVILSQVSSKDLANETAWINARRKKRQYKRFPAKLYRLVPNGSDGWSCVVRHTSATLSP